MTNLCSNSRTKDQTSHKSAETSPTISSHRNHIGQPLPGCEDMESGIGSANVRSGIGSTLSHSEQAQQAAESTAAFHPTTAMDLTSVRGHLRPRLRSSRLGLCQSLYMDTLQAEKKPGI